ncbi:MAG: phage tail protein [Smithella sp.]
MLQQHKDHAEMGTRLYELRKGIEILEDERKKSKANNFSGARRWFRGRFILTIFILWGFLGMGSLLYGEDTTTDALFVDDKGNVGIGKSAPEAKLDVAGTVKADEFTTTNGINLQIPIGTIMAYGGDTTNTTIKKQLEERGWLPCNGDFVSINQYKELHDVIGNAFGGDEKNNSFNLPDMRGRFLRGVAQNVDDSVRNDKNTKDEDKLAKMRDPDAEFRQQSAASGNKGNKVGSVQDDAIGQHKHKYDTNIRTWDERAGFNGKFLYGDGETAALHHDTTGNNVPPGGNETRPKNIYVNWIIKAK